MAERPERRAPKFEPRPLSEVEGARVLVSAAWACALIGLGSLLLEVWSGGWMAEALGVGVFLSLPLAVGGAMLTAMVAVRLGPRHGLGPGLVTLVYAVLFALTF